MKRSLEYAVVFANWCHNHNVSPRWLADLVELADRAFHAGERYANGKLDEDGYETYMDAVERKAAEEDFGVSWPGLWPMLTYEGQDYSLPCGS